MQDSREMSTQGSAQLTPVQASSPVLANLTDEDFADTLDQFFPESPPTQGSSHPRPPRAAGFADAFPDTAPAPVPAASQRTEDAARPSRPIPEVYRRHWERVPEILKNVPIQTKGVEAACMTPTREHEGKMYSESKCFSLVRANSLEVLASPQNGPSYCFVAEATTELPPHIQEAIYFFNACSNKYQTQDRSPFVFPTKDIGLQIDRANKKTVTGLFARGERVAVDNTVSPPSSQSSQSGAFISMKHILEARTQEQPEETRSPVHEIKMFVQFTGARFKDSEGEMVHKNFCVLTVSSPSLDFALPLGRRDFIPAAGDPPAQLLPVAVHPRGGAVPAQDG